MVREISLTVQWGVSANAYIGEAFVGVAWQFLTFDLTYEKHVNLLYLKRFKKLPDWVM
jgi:hypothetical protein